MGIRKPRKPRKPSKPGADIETSCCGGESYTPAPFWRTDLQPLSDLAESPERPVSPVDVWESEGFELTPVPPFSYKVEDPAQGGERGIKGVSYEWAVKSPAFLRLIYSQQMKRTCSERADARPSGRSESIKQIGIADISLICSISRRSSMSAGLLDEKLTSA